MARKTMQLRLLFAIVGVVAISTMTSRGDTPEGFTLKGSGRQYRFVRDCTAEQYNFSLTIAASEKDKDLDGFDLLFGVRPARHSQSDGGDAANCYRLLYAKRQLGLTEIRGGQANVLARSSLDDSATQRRVEVRRRGSALTVFIDGKRLLYALNSSFGAGRVAIAPETCPLTVRDWTYQPVADIIMSDDFTRSPTEKNNWQYLRGEWKVKTTTDIADSRPGGQKWDPGLVEDGARSANFFYFTGLADLRERDAITVTGYDFWDCYRVAASMRSAGGAVGLVFYARDAANYYVARWFLMTPREEEQPLELVRVQDGKETVIARASVRGAPGQWYRMEVVADGLRVQVSVDGSRILDCQNDGWSNGMVGLYQREADGCLFDDVSVTSNKQYTFDTAEMVALCGAPEAGKWTVEPLKEIGLAAETKRQGLKYTGDGPAWDTGAGLYWIGDPSWSSYAFACDIEKPGKDGCVGLAVRGRASPDASAPADIDLVLRSGSLPGRAGAFTQLLLVQNGMEKRVLTEAAEGISDDVRHEVRLDFTEKGKVEAYIDGILVLRADDPLDGGGRPGLYVLGGGSASFHDPRVLFAEARDVGAKVKNPIFSTDRYMGAWASDKMAWVKAEGSTLKVHPEGQTNLYWHKSDFYGRFELAIPLTGGFTAYLAADDANSDNRYQVVAKPPAENAAGRLELARNGETVAAEEIAPEAFVGSCRLIRDGAYVWATLGNEELFSYRDAAPLRGSRVGLITDDKRLATVDVRQYNVKDYLFDTAPSDWHAIGQWEETNRFTCDPRWAWFSGIQWDGLAAIWNKASFYGDVTVEFFAGMRGIAGKAMQYPRPGDINVTISAQPDELSTGYSAIYAAWDPFWSGKWTYLMKGLSKVAATDRELIPLVRDREPKNRVIPVPWDPSGARPIHGAWYSIKVRRQGDRIQCFFDDIPVMEYRDPTPLSGHKVAMWTQRDSIMVARARISYERKLDPVVAVKPLPCDGLALRYAVVDRVPSGKAAVVTSSTHPGIACDFEESLDGWKEEASDQGAHISLDSQNPGAGKSSLRLTNVNSGGTFGAILPIEKLQPFLVDDFEFRYRLNPDVKVNLYMKMTGGREFFIRLTGPEEPNGGLIYLGRIADVKADGQWHMTKFPLAAALQDWMCRAAANGVWYANARGDTVSVANFRCNEIRIGNYHEGYLSAGFNGNPRGATFWLDDFRVISAGGREARFAWSDAGKGSAYATSFSYAEPAEPTAAPEAAMSEAVLNADKDGLWYLNLKEFPRDGAAAVERHQPFYVDTSPLNLAAVEPTTGSQWGGDPIVLTLDSFRAGNVAAREMRLRINGQAIPYDARAMRFDWENHRLVISVQELRDAPVFNDGAPVAFELDVDKFTGVGRGSLSPIVWMYDYSPAADHTPPTAVSLGSYILKDDFEDGLRNVAYTDVHTAAFCEGPEQGSDGNSLKVIATMLCSRLEVALRPDKWPYDVARYPFLAFDYKISPSVHSNIYLETQGALQCIHFTDSDNQIRPIGAVPGVVTDGTWRHAEINLQELFAKAGLIGGRSQITQISFADRGYQSCPPGAFFQLDNVTLVPSVTSAQGLTLDWKARDTSSIKGYSFHWSASPAVEPDRTIDSESPGFTFSNVPGGTQYFHVRAQDVAGNWGPSSHYRFLVDGAAAVSVESGDNAAVK